MRLVNIETLQLEEFFEKDVPPYAILSHRWGSEELNFKDVLKDRVDKTRNGYKKLVSAAKIAANYKGVHHLWLDTCCIDKKSQLSEAINSMYRWYKEAQVCLTFLEDVTSTSNRGNSFRNSVWFTRSWTLQELLAPQVLHFYNREWKYIGNRDSLGLEIKETTGIDVRTIVSNPGLQYPLALRLSWAANRLATRTEDVAYSLMGLFGVNMPLLYGEREQAFLRLQEEILHRNTDLTFLLWALNSSSRRLFASSPADFKDLGLDAEDFLDPHTTRFSLTNMGLELKTDLIKVDMLTYGISLCEISGNRIYVLLLQKAPRAEVMYRIGLKILLSNPIPWREPQLWRERRQITLQREGPKSSLMVNTILPGVEVQSSLTLRLQPVTFEDGASPIPKKGVDRSKKHDSNSFHCEFEDDMQPYVLGLVLHFEDHSHLRIDLSLDFDSRPCALFHTRDTIQDVWRISNRIAEENRAAPRGNQFERKLIETDGAVFLRSPDFFPVSAYVSPGRLSPGQPQLWAGFYPPWSRHKEENLWCFRFASTKEELFQSSSAS